MKIDSNFECGNIIVESTSDQEATLSIRPDSNAHYFQWFYFRVEDAPNVPHRLTIANAGKSSYANAWNGYQALASYDEKSWFRASTSYDGDKLVIEHTPTALRTSYAFFVPYFQAQREALLKFCDSSPLASRRSLTTSPQGRS